MKITINYTQLAAEFVIVFFGVAVALAADSWREDLDSRRIERDYMLRLISDIDLGNRLLEDANLRFSEAQEATSFLIAHLENNEEITSAEKFIENFTHATRTGTTAGAYDHNIVFSELQSTGRLSLIQDSTLRFQIADYYRISNISAQEINRLPQKLWVRYRELTGREAQYYINASSYPDGEAGYRLVEELRSSATILEDLRFLHSRLDLVVQQVQYNVDLNRMLKAKIELYV